MVEEDLNLQSFLHGLWFIREVAIEAQLQQGLLIFVGLVLSQIQEVLSTLGEPEFTTIQLDEFSQDGVFSPAAVILNHKLTLMIKNEIMGKVENLGNNSKGKKG